MLCDTAHFEHGLPLLAQLDMGRLFAAYSKLESDKSDLSAITDLVSTVGGAAEARVLRKLSAVQRATFEQLIAAEDDPKILKDLETEAAGRGFTESIQDAADFFASLGLSALPTPSSSKVATEIPSKKKKPAVVSH